MEANRLYRAEFEFVAEEDGEVSVSQGQLVVALPRGEPPGPRSRGGALHACAGRLAAARSPAAARKPGRRRAASAIG